MKKVLVIISSSIWGGAQSHFYELTEGLVKRGFRVSVACPQGDLLDKLAPCHGIKIFKLSKGPITCFNLMYVFFREKPDIVHFHLFGAALYGLIATFVLRPPKIIYTVHNVVIYPGMKRWKRLLYPPLYKYLLRCVDCIIAVSGDIGKFLIRTFKIPKGKIWIIPNGVNFESSYRSNCELIKRVPASWKGDFIIGTVGRLAFQKGHRSLLEAMKKMIDINHRMRCVIVGEGPLRSELERFVRENSLGEYVLMPGYSKNVYSWFAAMDIAVFPSISEGLPIAHIEALFAGLPVIATDVGGTREVVQHSITGVLIPPNDPDALSRAILRLSREKDYRKKLGENGKKYIIERFSMKTCLEKVLEVYNS